MATSQGIFIKAICIVTDCTAEAKLYINDEQAVYWYRKAAEQGDDDGQFLLGYMYENGKGVAKDMGEAARLYRLAADQGSAAAQSSLSRLGR